jgi:uncharacterized protein YciI
MAYFVLICIDKLGALEKRLASREAHLAYLENHDGAVRLAGPFLDSEGKPAGSMLIVEAEDLAAAQAFADADPYAAAGLFEQVEVRAWRPTIGALP